MVTPVPAAPVEHRVMFETNQLLRKEYHSERVLHVRCASFGGVRWMCLAKVSNGERWIWANVTWIHGKLNAQDAAVLR